MVKRLSQRADSLSNSIMLFICRSAWWIFPSVSSSTLFNSLSSTLKESSRGVLSFCFILDNIIWPFSRVFSMSVLYDWSSKCTCLSSPRKSFIPRTSVDDGSQHWRVVFAVTRRDWHSSISLWRSSISAIHDSISSWTWIASDFAACHGILIVASWSWIDSLKHSEWYTICLPASSKDTISFSNSKMCSMCRLCSSTRALASSGFADNWSGTSSPFICSIIFVQRSTHSW